MTLREARVAAGLTQEELATRSGVDQRAISKIECSDVIDPQNSTVMALEKALRLPRGTLVFGRPASKTDMNAKHYAKKRATSVRNQTDGLVTA